MNYVQLMGAEAIQNAGHEIARAAESLRSSVESFGGHVRLLQRVLEEDRAARVPEKEVGDAR